MSLDYDTYNYTTSILCYRPKTKSQNQSNTPSSDSKLENRKRYKPKYGSSKDWMLDWQSPEAKPGMKDVAPKKKRVTISSPHLFAESGPENEAASESKSR